jgi:hypothetical protein
MVLNFLHPVSSEIARVFTDSSNFLFGLLLLRKKYVKLNVSTINSHSAEKRSFYL